MPTNRDVDQFIAVISQATGIGHRDLNRENAAYLWRVLHRHGVTIPAQIDKAVTDYIWERDGRPKPHFPESTRRVSSLFEALVGVGLFFQPKTQKPDPIYVESLPPFLRKPEIKEYLTQK